MSKLQIPPNAIEVLKAIIAALELAISHKDRHSVERFSAEFRLREKAALLPHRWCREDPLLYDCYLRHHRGAFFFVFLTRDISHEDQEFNTTAPLFEWWPENRIVGHNGKEYRIPIALGEGLSLLLQASWISGEDLLPDICDYMHKLIDKIIERQELVSEGVRNGISLPKLTNSGRTIECIKGSFAFTSEQAPFVSLFWENYLEGNEYLAEQDVLEEVGKSESRFEDIFKSRKDKFRAIFEQHQSEKDLWRLKLS